MIINAQAAYIRNKRNKELEKRTKINWKPFFDNTSTRDALADFIEGRPFRKSFQHIGWPATVTSQFRKMSRLKVDILRRRAAQAYLKHYGPI